MHWFWRAAISILVSCVLVSLLWSVVDGLMGSAVRWLRARSAPLDPEGLVLGFLVVFPAMLLGFAIFGIMARFWSTAVIDHETRCRKCGYILRGISEPRCPECGERI